jgi:hypothetical protein
VLAQAFVLDSPEFQQGGGRDLGLRIRSIHANPRGQVPRTPWRRACRPYHARRPVTTASLVSGHQSVGHLRSRQLAPELWQTTPPSSSSPYPGPPARLRWAEPTGPTRGLEQRVWQSVPMVQDERFVGREIVLDRFSDRGHDTALTAAVAWAAPSRKRHLRGEARDRGRRSEAMHGSSTPSASSVAPHPACQRVLSGRRYSGTRGVEAAFRLAA